MIAGLSFVAHVARGLTLAFLPVYRLSIILFLSL